MQALRHWHSYSVAPSIQPRCIKKTQDSWRLRFKVITPQGGVKEIAATGRIAPLTIEEIAIERIFDDGEFSNLLEG